MRIYMLVLPLLLAVSACGMKKFEDVSHELPDGSTLEVRGQWAETFSLGYVGQETYRCDEGYNVVKATKVEEFQKFFDGQVNYEVMCEQISSYHHADRGIVRGTMEGVAPAAVGGWFYMKGQEKRRPDRIDIQNEGSNAEASGGEAYAEGGQGGAGGAGGTAAVSVVNSVSNSQSQGQLQGQTQGQASHNNNSNYNSNVNVNKPTATAVSAPHISNKPTFNNNNINKPVNVNVNKPVNNFKPVNNSK